AARAHGWFVTMAIYAVICVVCFFITFFTTTERVKPVQVEKTPLSRDLSDLFKNGPWVVMFLMTVFHFGLLSFRGGAEYQYYMRYADQGACYDFLQHLGLTNPDRSITDAPQGVFGQLGYIVNGPRELAMTKAPSAVFGLVGMVGKIVTIISIIFAPLL